MRSAKRAASQLPGRGPLLWILPQYLHVNQTSDDEDECPFVYCIASTLLFESVTQKPFEIHSQNLAQI